MMALGPQTAAAGPAGKPDYGSVIRARQHNVAPLPAAVTSTGTRNRPRQLLEQPAAAQPLAVAHMTQSFGGAWSELGPAPITDARCCGAQPPDFNGAVSGKINALAVDPTNANVLYAGAGEGGVWKTMDAGSTWAPLTDDRESMAIGSLAIMFISSSFTCMRSKQRHQAPGFGRGRRVLVPFGCTARSSEWMSQ